MSRIVKISQNNSDESFDFGTTFDNVTYEWEENDITKYFTLKELYLYLKDFFDNGTFVMYSEDEPKNSNVKVWYDTKVQTM